MRASWLDYYFLPFVVVSSAWIVCLSAFDGFPVELALALVATGIAVWTAHTATKANDRREELDRRDRLMVVYRAGLEVMNFVLDPDDVIPKEKRVELYQRFTLALETVHGVVDLPRCEELHQALHRLMAGWQWEKLDVRGKTLRALTEVNRLRF